MSDEKKIYVRYAPVGGNALPLSCKSTDTIYELATLLKDNATKFDLGSEDIKIRQMGLWLKTDKGETRKLEFHEPVSVIQSNYVVEFSEQIEQTYSIPVRYIKSVNPVRIPYIQSNDVSDLARYIRENIAVFRLAPEVTDRAKQDGSEVVLMQIIDDHKKIIDPHTTVRSLEGSQIVFKIKSSTDPLEGEEIWVKYSTSRQPIRFLCPDDARVADLAVQIKTRITDFYLTDDVKKELEQRESEIILRTIPSTPGEESIVLDPFSSIKDVRQRHLEFSVQTRKMRIVTLDDIREKCHGQNIALMGAPGHGKSSTINTIIRALSRLHTPLASTWKEAATGTAALTPFKIDLKGKYFKCIDVPGNTLRKLQNESGNDKVFEVIKDIFDGKYPANEPLDFWKWYSPVALAKQAFLPKTGVIHTVVIVQKGDADPDKLGSSFINVAQAKGRAIPVFVIVTHIDLMTSEAVDTAVSNISHTLGIDPSRIFRLSNIDHKEGIPKAMEYTKEDTYIHRILLGLLSAGEVYQKRGNVKIECESMTVDNFLTNK